MIRGFEPSAVLSAPRLFERALIVILIPNLVRVHVTFSGALPRPPFRRSAFWWQGATADDEPRARIASARSRTSFTAPTQLANGKLPCLGASRSSESK